MDLDHAYILVTGANIGLGHGICIRLIDEFLTIHPSPSAVQLTLIFTTRSSTKGRATLAALSAHLQTKGHDSNRIHLRPENVELTSLPSIRALATKLTGPTGISHLDALILNAGVAGTTGINWPVAIHQILTEQTSAVTWPRFKLSAVGSITELQFPVSDSTNKSSKKDAAPPSPEPPLSQVFCANVFGHYLLSHWTMSLLRRRNDSKPGRIIWISSIEASDAHFVESDLQGLRSTTAYEHSKRLTDLLALTATSPETQSSVESFTSTDDAHKRNSNEKMGPPQQSSSPTLASSPHRLSRFLRS